MGNLRCAHRIHRIHGVLIRFFPDHYFEQIQIFVDGPFASAFSATIPSGYPRSSQRSPPKFPSRKARRESDASTEIPEITVEAEEEGALVGRVEDLEKAIR